MPIHILVTGISGDLGQAVVKALQLMDEPVRIFGCDMQPDIGRAYTEDAFPVPAAAHIDYLPEIRRICSEARIQAIVPASEPEIRALGKAVLEKKSPPETSVVCQAYPWFQRFGDKLACYEQLSGKIDLAPFADGTDADALARFVSDSGCPCIVKSRRSYGSKSIRIAKNNEDLASLVTQIPDPVVQGFIDDAHGEFSVGVFSCDQFTSAIAFKRDLGPSGNSWYADNTDQDPLVLAYALAAVEAAGLVGACNVQVRKNEQGVRLLEINPRFSSLVAARAICGFTDLAWSLKLALGLPIETPRPTYKTLRFRRYFHELVDFGDGYFAPVQWQPRTRIPESKRRQ